MAAKIEIAEDQLVALLRSQNSKGIEILYDNYSSALFGVIQRIVMEEEAAEDILQDSFIKIWNNFGSYDASKGRLFTWMVNICRNTAIDKVRSAQYINEIKNRSVPDTVSTNEEGFIYNPETVDVKRIVEKLGPEYKQVIDLLYFGGYSQSEAAEKLQIPLGTVKTRARTAIQRLKLYFS